MQLRCGYVFLSAVVLLAAVPRVCGDDAFLRRAEQQLASLVAIETNLPTSPAERAMFTDAADGRWDEFDLLSAAIIAERASVTSREVAAKNLERHVARLRQQLPKANAQRYAETLFNYLHQHMLTGRFAADCHSVERTLRTGDYNCLTGVVLFVGLAQRCGISAKGVLAPSHVYARAMIDGVWRNIETTSPGWFSESAPRQRQLLSAALGNDSAVSASRELDAVKLLAVVYYNRGVVAFNERNYAAATASNLLAIRLDPQNRSASDNLLAAINNWALQAAKQGDARTAAMVLERGRRIAPDRADFKATAKFVAGE